MSHVYISGDCWIWMGARHYRGYGHFQWTTKHTERAHRASWMLFEGEIPAGKIVCHDCDVPLCVKPSHLFLGTQYDNVQDQRRKGRLKKAKGPEHYRWNPALHKGD